MNDYLFEQSRSLLMNNTVDISRKKLHYEQMKTAYPTYVAYLSFMKPKHLHIDLMLQLAKDGIIDLLDIVRGLDVESLHKIEGSRVAVEYVNKNFGFPDYLYDLLAVDFSYDDIELERLRLDRSVGESDNKARNFKI